MTGIDHSSDPDPDVDLDARVRQADGGVVLEVAGEVDLRSGDRFHAALEQAWSGRPAVLVADLRGVGFLGSIGLAHLLEANSAVGGGALRVVPSAAARRTIEVAGLHPVLTMYEAVADALAAPR